MYQKHTWYNNAYKAPCGKAWLCHWLPCWVLIRTAQTCSCIFHLRPHLSFVIIGFGNNSPGSEPETGKRLFGDRGGQKRVNSPERPTLSFRISGEMSSASPYENQLPVPFNFKVKCPAPPSLPAPTLFWLPLHPLPIPLSSVPLGVSWFLRRAVAPPEACLQ